MILIRTLDLAQFISNHGNPSKKFIKLIEFVKRRLEIDSNHESIQKVTNLQPPQVGEEQINDLNQAYLSQLEYQGQVTNHNGATLMEVDFDEGEWNLVFDWQKCPIGTLAGGSTIPDLDLDPQFDDLKWIQENDLLRYPGDIETVVTDTKSQFRNNFPVQIF